MLKDIIEERQREAWRTATILDAYQNEHDCSLTKIELNAIIKDTAQIVAREVVRKIEEHEKMMATAYCGKLPFPYLQAHRDIIILIEKEAHLQSLEEELTK